MAFQQHAPCRNGLEANMPTEYCDHRRKVYLLEIPIVGNQWVMTPSIELGLELDDWTYVDCINGKPYRLQLVDRELATQLMIPDYGF